MRHVPSVQSPSLRRCSLSCASRAARNSSPSCSVFLSVASCVFVWLASLRDARRTCIWNPSCLPSRVLNEIPRHRIPVVREGSVACTMWQQRRSNSERVRQSNRSTSHCRKGQRQTRPSSQRATTTRPRNSYSSFYSTAFVECVQTYLF